jgi:Tol biopolymer transport system component
MTVTADGTRTAVVIATAAEQQHGAWSPDGNSIAFSNGTGGGADLYTVSVVTREGKGLPWGPPRQLSSDTGVDAR